jgi:hypothetical protein
VMKKTLDDLRAKQRAGSQRIATWAGETSTALVPLGVSPIPALVRPASISDALPVQSWLGMFSSAPIGSPSWYFLSFDLRNKTDHRAVGRVGLRYLTIPSDFTAPNHPVVWLPGLITQFGCRYTSQGRKLHGR